MNGMSDYQSSESATFYFIKELTEGGARQITFY
ncbi:hypothetical protein ABH963_003740 [Bacillus sp. RC55]|jgi:hypothetical protein|uniref:Uncharacterized protein n=1 Tax=Bacillus thuringiensis serovar toumanoffi TaxID=180862 RepID=A0ABD5HR04_BACTU|nr:hypothetical protein [Bacillus thuringiensis serovar toumanoffi]